MDMQLTGYNNRGSIERELVNITSREHLSLVISGKPSHPYSGLLQAEKSVPVKVFFPGSKPYSIQIYNGQDLEIYDFYYDCDTHIYTKPNIPLFYEQRTYQFALSFMKQDPKDTVEIWHESKQIRDAFMDVEKLNREKLCTIVGNINFGNEIGYTEFEVRVNGITEVFLTLEILPSKMDYQMDYQMMLYDITNELYNLVFDFLKKTWQFTDLGKQWGNTDTEFFSIIRRLYDEIIHSVNVIIHKGHFELQKNREYLPAHKMRNPDSRTILWMSHHSGSGKRLSDGRIRFEKIECTKKEMTFDTLENQFVKHILVSTMDRLEGLKEKYCRPYSRKSGSPKRNDPEIVNTIDQMTAVIRQKIKSSFLSSVSKWKATRSLSLVFAMAPGYKELYQNYMKLNMGLRLSGDVFRIPMKDTALLYEYWCYIKLNRLIYDKRRPDGSRKYPVKEGNLFKYSDSGITVDLQKGKSKSRICYKDLCSGEEVILSYNPSYQQGKTITQKPDNVVSITKNGKDDRFSYVFDAKYRIDGVDSESNYAKTYGGPGPVEDTINTMHRYRDAITFRNILKDPDSGFVREMFGAYVLFPYADTEGHYKNHPFYKSIDAVNIGGLPFLPGNTRMVEELLDRLIEESPESSFERASLPVGVTERLQKADLTKRNVLVGLCICKEQYDFCLRHSVYYWPAKNIDEKRFPLEYIAIYKTKGLFGDGNDGIKDYGSIRYYEKMTGYQLQERFAEKAPLNNDQLNELYFVFEIEENWRCLDRTIVSDDSIRHHFYTNIDLLKCSKTRKELSMTSLEQLRLYTELQRLTGSVSIEEHRGDGTMDVTGFEYRGRYISKFGDYVYVYHPGKVNKSYLLAYATKCRKKFFEDVLRDVEN